MTNLMSLPRAAGGTDDLSPILGLLELCVLVPFGAMPVDLCPYLTDRAASFRVGWRPADSQPFWGHDGIVYPRAKGAFLPIKKP